MDQAGAPAQPPDEVTSPGETLALPSVLVHCCESLSKCVQSTHNLGAEGRR